MARTKHGEAETKWRGHVDAWSSSKLSLRAFAEREGLNPNTLWSWKRKLVGVTRKYKTPTFAAVLVTPERAESTATAHGAASTIEIALPSGLAIRLLASIDDATLVRVVRALEVAR